MTKSNRIVSDAQALFPQPASKCMTANHPNAPANAVDDRPCAQTPASAQAPALKYAGAGEQASSAESPCAQTSAAHAPFLTRRGFMRLAACAVATAATGCLSGCGASAPGPFAATRSLVDDTGRTVTLPTPGALSRIYFTSPLPQIFCFTIAPDLQAGTAIQFTEGQLEFLPAGTSDLIYYGSLSQGNTIDSEMLVASGTQVVFSISGKGLTDVNVADALSLENATGIPVFLIDGSLERIGDTYRLLGEALGRQERAEELARYCERIYAKVTEAVARVPEDERVSYYFAEGAEGLQTEPNASQHSLAFLVAGGRNVAADVPAPASVEDMADVTIEQVRAWNPDFIIAWDWDTRGGAADYIRHASSWAGIAAVEQGRVYTMPHVPFPFCDRPPGVNRLLGIQWLANLFYPEHYDVDMVDVVREFCSVCYWRDISREQAERILNAT